MDKTEEMKEAVYARNTVEFVTVAAEFCAYIEQAEGRKRADFVDTVLKLLPLLYLKGLLLETIESDEEFLPEAFVSEHDYEYVRFSVAAIMGERDDYLDVCDDNVRYNDEVEMKTVSESLADIYQAMKDFVETYKMGLEENMYEALAAVRDAFELYWGQRVTDTMRALHRVKYAVEEENNDEEDIIQ